MALPRNMHNFRDTIPPQIPDAPEANPAVRNITPLVLPTSMPHWRKQALWWKHARCATAYVNQTKQDSEANADSALAFWVSTFYLIKPDSLGSKCYHVETRPKKLRVGTFLLCQDKTSREIFSFKAKASEHTQVPYCFCWEILIAYRTASIYIVFNTTC